MSDDSDFQFSDDDLNDKNHAKIIENVLSLNKAQHLKRPSRTEPTLHVSEFNLVRSVTGHKGSVQIDDLAKVLKTRKKHIEIGKKVESTKKKTHTLPKPLEKPHVERIRRSVGYERNRLLFDRWDAFVTANRAQAHQVFPIGSVEKLNIEAKQAAKFTSNWTYKSELQKELEKIDAEIEEYRVKDENGKDEFPLTLQELKEKRKEAAKLRAHQSFREAKARRQNKIKSKKYHRILRKEKIKQKLKEFEELQKTNPEEALKKLEEIEKARALERYSLRHKGTGQWAKSKQVRAKYDKASRQVLAQQLQLSRELTQKQKHLDSDSEDDGLETEGMSNLNVPNSENPWIAGPKPDKEVTEFVSGYKKFWTEQNKKVEVEHLKDDEKEGSISGDSNTNSDHEDIKDENISDKSIVLKISGLDESKTDREPKISNEKKLKRKKANNKKETIKMSLEKKLKSNLNNSSGNWDIEEIFDSAEKKAAEKLKKKLCLNKKEKGGKRKKNEKKNLKKKNSKKVDLTMQPQSRKHFIDEEMLEQPLNEEQSTRNNDINTLKNIIDDGLGSQKKIALKQLRSSENIDPDKFIKLKVTNLDSAIPDLMVEDENTEENSQKNIIMEAFEDNDITDDFTKEKQEEVDKGKPQDIDLNLPGWGSWAGTGINSKKQRKRKRFIVRMPEVMPRRDDNKGSLIINEKAAAKIKPHLVAEVPFPFKTVKDYEASIRAPIGNTFVPELAYRRFIRPAVETKMGTIIEPANTSFLMGIPKKQQAY